MALLYAPEQRALLYWLNTLPRPSCLLASSVLDVPGALGDAVEHLRLGVSSPAAADVSPSRLYVEQRNRPPPTVSAIARVLEDLLAEPCLRGREPQCVTCAGAAQRIFEGDPETAAASLELSGGTGCRCGGLSFAPEDGEQSHTACVDPFEGISFSKGADDDPVLCGDEGDVPTLGLDMDLCAVSPAEFGSSRHPANLQTSVKLCQVLEKLENEKVPCVDRKPTRPAAMIHNIDKAFEVLRRRPQMPLRHLSDARAIKDADPVATIGLLADIYNAYKPLPMPRRLPPKRAAKSPAPTLDPEDPPTFWAPGELQIRQWLLDRGVAMREPNGVELNHFHYTVLGNSVNLAARLEPMNKYFGTRILVCEATQAVVQEKLIMRKLGNVRVKGFAQLQQVFELVGRLEMTDPVVMKRVQLFNDALGAIDDGCLEVAKEKLQQYLDEGTDTQALRFVRKIDGVQNGSVPEDEGTFVIDLSTGI
eukprot:m51a1_g111 putative adenylate guanylate cyclase with chase sensor (477) ;mRNA; f:331624-347362